MTASLSRSVVARSVAIAFACGSAGCAPTLLSSSAPAPEPADRALRCIDVAMAPVAPAEGQSVSSVRILYMLHNRCDHPVTLDFARAVVDARFEGDRDARLVPYPASGAALSSELDTYGEGTEAIWYVRPSSSAPGRPIGAFCVNVGPLEAASAAPTSCFRRAPVAGFVHVAGARTLDEALDAAPDGAPSAMITPTSQYWFEDDDDGFVPIRCYGANRGDRRTDFCDAFGLWKRPLPFFASFGSSAHRLDLRRRSFDTGAPIGVVSTEAAGAELAESVDFDLGAYVLGPLFVGGEIQFGGGSIPTAQIPSALDVTISGGNVYFAGGAIMGIASPRLGPFDASLEVFAGGVDQVVEYDQRGAQCDGACAGNVSSWYVEPRVGITAWLTPHWSVGAWGGVGVTEPGDGSIGVTLGGHLRSFDGTP